VDQDEDTEYIIRPARHDRFSVLVPALQAAAQTAAVLANTFNTYSMMAMQHSMIKEYDREFQRITEGFGNGSD
jgi:hypothetical protein